MGDKKIAIIGGGNLGQAIMKGLLANKVYTPQTSLLPNAIQPAIRIQKVRCAGDSRQCATVANSELIILALKPYKILSVLEEILPQLEADKHLIVSLASGISISQLNDTIINKVPVYRMPIRLLWLVNL